MLRIDTKTTANFDYAYFDLNSDDLIIESFISKTTDHDDKFFEAIKNDDVNELFMRFDCLEALKTTIDHAANGRYLDVTKENHQKFLSLRDKFSEAIKLIDTLTVTELE